MKRQAPIAPGPHAFMFQKPVMLRRSAAANVAFALQAAGRPADPATVALLLVHRFVVSPSSILCVTVAGPKSAIGRKAVGMGRGAAAGSPVVATVMSSSSTYVARFSTSVW